MSRLAKKPIEIPVGVTIKKDGGSISVKGSLGEVTREFKDNVIKINVTDKEITLERNDRTKFSQALLGTYASLLKGMIHGVTTGFQKVLIVEGTGYRANVNGNKLVLSLGYSHPVEMDIPEGIKVEVEKDQIKIYGIDKVLVGQFAANVRIKRGPEPYKGKGVRYEGEYIDRKQGKKAVT